MNQLGEVNKLYDDLEKNQILAELDDPQFQTNKKAVCFL